MRRTKIVCTLGPAVATPDKLEGLIRNGMNVARFNFSHGSYESHREMFDMLDEVRTHLGSPVAAMLDTKGPEIRTGEMENGEILLVSGNKIVLTSNEVIGTSERIAITYPLLYRDVSKGSRILLDDGLMELSVERVVGEDIECTVVSGGTLSNRKGVNVPGIQLSLPYISEKDKTDIEFAVKTGFDFIAASFVNRPEDVLEIRSMLDKLNCQSIKIISKIESVKGLENIDEIIKVSDGIMVARGDMGVELPPEEVPVVQKQLIKKAIENCKMVITATQMLDSMTKNPRPTRAEATDVANAIYDGTSAVMLSGETAVGKYPLDAVLMMATIAQRAEQDIDYRARLRDNYNPPENPDLTYAIAHATCTTAHVIDAKAIVTITHSGYTAKITASMRPSVPVIGCTPLLSTYRHLSMSWGVVPLLMAEEKESSDRLIDNAIEAARQAGVLLDGDLAVISAGVPIGVPGTTNLIKAHVVGNVLAAGEGVGKGKIISRLCVANSTAEALKIFSPGDILVIPKTTNELMPLLKTAAGIICEESGMNSHGAVVGLTLDIPTVVGVKNAVKLLKHGLTASLDAAQGTVSAR